MKRQPLAFATGVLAVLMLLEIIFRLLPVSTATRSGYYIRPLIITYPAHHCFTAATGWDLKNAQHNCANNYGFLADRDFVRDPQAIALIGDSFVEANMLPASQRLGAQLQAMLPGQVVYAMGGPGSSLLDYAERAKFAAEEFGIRRFVFIIERGDIEQVFCGSGNIHGPCLDARTLEPRTELQAPPGTLKRILRESALAQYVFSQIRFDISRAISNPFRPAVEKSALARKNLPLAASERVIATFFGRLSTIEGVRFMFLIDADRAHLFDTRVNDREDLKALRRAAEELGGAVIDPAPFFRRFVVDSGIALEVGPYDRHWNGKAVQLIAGLIAQHLPLLCN
jgi:hypothetical protein